MTPTSYFLAHYFLHHSEPAALPVRQPESRRERAHTFTTTTGQVIQLTDPVPGPRFAADPMETEAATTGNTRSAIRRPRSQAAADLPQS